MPWLWEGSSNPSLILWNRRSVKFVLQLHFQRYSRGCFCLLAKLYESHGKGGKRHRNSTLKSYFKDYHLLEPSGLEWERSKSKLIGSKPAMHDQAATWAPSWAQGVGGHILKYGACCSAPGQLVSWPQEPKRTATDVLLG